MPISEELHGITLESRVPLAQLIPFEAVLVTTTPMADSVKLTAVLQNILSDDFSIS